jgi:hypothetical protein
MPWSQLQAILGEARSEGERQRAQKPVACPNDGEPLVSARGVLHCRFCGYEYDG